MTALDKVDTVIMHILAMGRLRHKLVKLLAQMSSRLHMI